MRRLGWILFLLLPLTWGCSGEEKSCGSHASTACIGSVNYWLDGCGNPEEIQEICSIGCNALGTGCLQSCVPDCTGRCCGGDGCGGTCRDNCSLTGQVCNATSCGCEGACTPLTCSALSKQCGLWSDGCGQQLNCGDCPGGQYCNLGTCQASCTPRTCSELGKQCGSWPDGCGGQVTCPACPTGYSCSSEGQCQAGCTPKTCSELGKQCGSWADGCGGQALCGDCPTGQTCDTSGQCQTTTLPRFSFFVTSLKAIRELSGSQDGFGGDLRYGETGDRAGLRGADKICAAIAERSMPGSSQKQWRAFLCTSYEDAIDRIGEGPWYDRLGRLFANNKSELLYTRPLNADPAIKNDFPNEDGVPNHAPDGVLVDNHDMITGCNTQGRLYSATAACQDWTSTSKTVGRPRVGHSWPRTGILPPGGDMNHWISALDESGCAPGVNLVETGAPGTDGTIGSGGGYGGFYCFALEP